MLIYPSRTNADNVQLLLGEHGVVVLVCTFCTKAFFGSGTPVIICIAYRDNLATGDIIPYGIYTVTIVTFSRVSDDAYAVLLFHF